MERKIRPVIFSLILFVLGFHLLGAIAPASTVAKWFLTDDAFFYFVVARNIVAGNGITFDGFAPASGFHPLWMLVNLPVFAISGADRILPLRILIMVMGILNAGTTYLVYRIAAKTLSAEIAAVAAALWAFIPSIHAISARNGLESPLSAFLLALLVFTALRLQEADNPPRSHLLLAGLVGGLAFLARLDNIFTVSMVGAWIVFRRLPGRTLLLADILSFYVVASASLMLRLGLGDTFYQYSHSIFYLFLCAAAGRIPLYFAFGLYQQTDLTSANWLKQAGLAALLGAALTSLLMLALTFAGVVEGFPRAALIYEAGLGLLALLLTRGLTHLVSGKSRADQDPLALLNSNWKNWMLDAAAYFGVVAVILAAYVGWSMLTYGTPTPVSGQIKEWWGTLPDTVYGDPARNALTFYGFDPEDGKSPWTLANGFLFALQPLRTQTAILLTWFGLAMLGLFLLKKGVALLPHLPASGLLPLFAGGMFQYWTYTTRAYVGLRNWYWTAEMLFTVLAGAILLEIILGFIRDPLYRKSAQTLAVIIASMLLAYFFITNQAGLITQNAPSEEAQWYLTNTRALEANTAPGDVIGMTGGGDIAYFISDRTIVNLDGLINSTEYFALLKQFRAAEYAARVGMDYIYAKPYMLLQSDPYRQNFAPHVTQLATLGEFTLFKFDYPK